ncbi:MAG TPA: DUF6134 family protein [Urbifossiella sp.]|jgi:hypothetical protein|nr:DUF6134 family protein [Urbifossiella sp.]
MPRSAALVLAAALAGPAAAAETELRTFAVSVDGKAAGTYKMAVRVDDDGTETVAADASIKVRIAVVSYTYTIQSNEVWKGGRLAAVESYTNDDGKRHSVKGATTADGLTVTADGKIRTVRADVLTSTGWRFPGPAAAPRDVIVFDVEDGTETAAKLEPLPPSQVVVGGRRVEAQRFKVTGRNLDAVWWYDPAGRPVRQEMRWDGHRVVLDLTAITR